jgi:tRNA (cytidine/uridine-2'-O-)-methyltransferase
MNDLSVVLVEPEIAPNVGAIGRLCAALGAMLHLIGPLGFRLDEKNLRRAGMDYWEHLQWKAWPDWKGFCQEHDVAARGWLFTTKTSRNYLEATYRTGDFLIFGRETKGLPEPLLQAHPDRCVTIPMANPQTRSLNVATAAAMALGEGVRQIRTKLPPA